MDASSPDPGPDPPEARRWKALWRTLPTAIVVHAADTTLQDANPAACALLNEPLEAMRGRPAHHPMWSFVEADGTAMPVARYPAQQLLAHGRLDGLVLGICPAPGGRPRWVLCEGFTLANAAGALHEIVVTFGDLTPLKLSQQALASSESRLALTGQIARVGGWTVERPISRQTRLDLTAEAANLLGGVAPEALSGAPTLAAFLERVSGADRAALRRAVRSSLRLGGAALDTEVTIDDTQGRPRNFRLAGRWRRDGARAVALEGAVQDTTEWQHARQQLHLLASAVERLNDVVLITEADPIDEPGPRVVFVNAAFERLTGYTRGEIVGRSPRILQGAATSRHELTRIRHALASGASVSVELINYRKDGGEYWVEIEIVPLTDERGRVYRYVSIQRDVTRRRALEAERRVLEQQLQEAQKMESIGTLAGGIAHDFNNILPAILGNAELARESLPPDHAAAVNLEQIRKAAFRGRAMVQQILAFSRRETARLRPLLVAPIVEETLMLLRSTLPAAVELRVVPAPGPLAAVTDATQLQQVLINLCTNGWHALGGRAGEIEVGWREHDSSRRDDVPPVAGRWVHLWVRDNGAGMAPATRSRIFEPFFTTKPVGSGTGLGLSVVHGILQRQGGHVDVQSTPGVGTVFNVYLRLATDPVDADEAPSPAPQPGARGELVLYVDDDDLVGLLVKNLLERRGFRVELFASGESVLAWARQVGAVPRLLITDYNMPSMTGAELAAQLRGVFPGLPVIVTSGNITAEIGRQAAAVGAREVLEKQHMLERLTIAVCAALGIVSPSTQPR